jgi:hypothetical protein
MAQMVETAQTNPSELADVPARNRRDSYHMSMLKVFAGFVPWIIFSFVAEREGPGAVATAGFLAFLVAAAFIVHSLLRGEMPKILEVTGAIAFAAIGIASVLDPATDAFLGSYGRSIATWTLAIVIFVMLPIMPFTEQYARESVPREYWHTPQFRSVNRRISAVWGIAIASMGAGHLLSALFSYAEAGTTVPNRPVDLVFDWILPILLTWWAVRYTIRASKAAHHAAPPESGRAADAPSDRTA